MLFKCLQHKFHLFLQFDIYSIQLALLGGCFFFHVSQHHVHWFVSQHSPRRQDVHESCDLGTWHWSGGDHLCWPAQSIWGQTSCKNEMLKTKTTSMFFHFWLWKSVKMTLNFVELWGLERDYHWRLLFLKAVLGVTSFFNIIFNFLPTYILYIHVVYWYATTT